MLYEVITDSLPIIPPGLANRRMTAIPFVFKTIKLILCFFNRRCRVDCFQVGSYFFALFPGDIVQAMANHVNNTELNLCIWKNRLDGFWETF